MKKRDVEPVKRRDVGRARGVLPSPVAGSVEHRRVGPSAALAEHLAHFWWVRWDVERPSSVSTLPHPCVHVLFESGRPAVVHGVSERRFERVLEGRGFVFGIKFRPAAFSPLWPAALRSLSNRSVPLETVFGRPARAWERDVLHAQSFEARITLSEAFLGSRLPALAPEVVLARDLVEQLERDHALCRVEQAAARVGLDVRALQRLFRQHVGVTPKWVLRRYRLHEAAARLTTTPKLSLARLAADLGYADQAHFTRDFTATVGRTPGSFRSPTGFTARRTRAAVSR